MRDADHVTRHLSTANLIVSCCSCTSTMSGRLDGHGYIDEAQAVEPPTVVPASDSGSSIEEEISISSSERSAVSEGEEEEEDEEWDAQGEDWDLATGGTLGISAR